MASQSHFSYTAGAVVPDPDTVVFLKTGSSVESAMDLDTPLRHRVTSIDAETPIVREQENPEWARHLKDVWCLLGQTEAQATIFRKMLGSFKTWAGGWELYHLLPAGSNLRYHVLAKLSTHARDATTLWRVHNEVFKYVRALEGLPSMGALCLWQQLSHRVLKRLLALKSFAEPLYIVCPTAAQCAEHHYGEIARRTTRGSIAGNEAAAKLASLRAPKA